MNKENIDLKMDLENINMAAASETQELKDSGAWQLLQTLKNSHKIGNNLEVSLLPKHTSARQSVQIESVINDVPASVTPVIKNTEHPMLKMLSKDMVVTTHNIPTIGNAINAKMMNNMSNVVQKTKDKSVRFDGIGNQNPLMSIADNQNTRIWENINNFSNNNLTIVPVHTNDMSSKFKTTAKDNITIELLSDNVTRGHDKRNSMFSDGSDSKSIKFKDGGNYKSASDMAKGMISESAKGHNDHGTKSYQSEKHGFKKPYNIVNKRIPIMSSNSDKPMCSSDLNNYVTNGGHMRLKAASECVGLEVGAGVMPTLPKKENGVGSDNENPYEAALAQANYIASKILQSETIHCNIPIVPNPKDSKFLELIGLDLVVDSITGKRIHCDNKRRPNLICKSCQTDVSRTWHSCQSGNELSFRCHNCEKEDLANESLINSVTVLNDFIRNTIKKINDQGDMRPRDLLESDSGEPLNANSVENACFSNNNNDAHT